MGDYRPMKTVSLGNKTWRLPVMLEFGSFGNCVYEVIDFRAPKAGEFYLSGAIIAAYQSACDGSSEYLIAKPTHRAKVVPEILLLGKVTQN